MDNWSYNSYKQGAHLVGYVSFPAGLTTQVRYIIINQGHPSVQPIMDLFSWKNLAGILPHVANPRFGQQPTNGVGWGPYKWRKIDGGTGVIALVNEAICLPSYSSYPIYSL